MRQSQPRNGKKATRKDGRNGSDGKLQNRTALLVRCSADEAAAIRAAAKGERRTLSGFILHAAMNRLRSYQVATSYLPRPNVNGHPPPEKWPNLRSRSGQTATL